MDATRLDALKDELNWTLEFAEQDATAQATARGILLAVERPDEVSARITASQSIGEDVVALSVDTLRLDEATAIGYAVSHTTLRDARRAADHPLNQWLQQQLPAENPQALRNFLHAAVGDGPRFTRPLSNKEVALDSFEPVLNVLEQAFKPEGAPVSSFAWLQQQVAPVREALDIQAALLEARDALGPGTQLPQAKADIPTFDYLTAMRQDLAKTQKDAAGPSFRAQLKMASTNGTEVDIAGSSTLHGGPFTPQRLTIRDEKNRAITVELSNLFPNSAGQSSLPSSSAVGDLLREALVGKSHSVSVMDVQYALTRHAAQEAAMHLKGFAWREIDPTGRTPKLEILHTDTTGRTAGVQLSFHRDPQGSLNFLTTAHPFIDTPAGRALMDDPRLVQTFAAFAEIPQLCNDNNVDISSTVKLDPLRSAGTFIHSMNEGRDDQWVELLDNLTQSLAAIHDAHPDWRPGLRQSTPGQWVLHLENNGYPRIHLDIPLSKRAFGRMQADGSGFGPQVSARQTHLTYTYGPYPASGGDIEVKSLAWKDAGFRALTELPGSPGERAIALIDHALARQPERDQDALAAMLSQRMGAPWLETLDLQKGEAVINLMVQNSERGKAEARVLTLALDADGKPLGFAGGLAAGMSALGLEMVAKPATYGMTDEALAFRQALAPLLQRQINEAVGPAIEKVKGLAQTLQIESCRFSPDGKQVTVGVVGQGEQTFKLAKLEGHLVLARTEGKPLRRPFDNLPLDLTRALELLAAPLVADTLVAQKAAQKTPRAKSPVAKGSDRGSR